MGARVSLVVQANGPRAYLITNEGEEDAEEVCSHDGDEVTSRAQYLPDGISIPKGHSHEFFIYDDAAFIVPNALLFSWKGSNGPHKLPIKPY